MKKKKPIIRLLVLFVPVFIQISSFAQEVITADNDARIMSEVGSYWVIDNGAFTLFSPNAATPVTMANLKIESGTSLSIAPQSFLTINGTLTNSGTLTIQSSSSGTGSLIHNTENITGIMQRFIPAATWEDKKDGWHFLSSPVADYQIATNFTVVPASDYDFYAWSQPDNLWVNYKDGTNPTFAGVNGSTAFKLGHGYMAAYKTEATKAFAGYLNVSDVLVSNLAISSGSNNGWHLLGNPYSAALIWDATTDWNKTNIGGVANLWNEEGQSYTPISAGGIIPSENGFMVQASGGIGSLNIPAAKRTHNAQAWYKNSGYPVIQLFAVNLVDSSFQESQIRFNPEATVGFDIEHDGRFLSGYAPLFYSVSAGENLMVNSLPESSAETVIPFNFIKNEGSNFAIEAKGIETLDPAATVYLKDNKLRINHNLSENPVYKFTSTVSDIPNRFELRFGTVGIYDLPVAQSINAWVYNNMLYVHNPDGITRIEVFDLIGQRLLSTQLSSIGLQSLPLHQLIGLYFIRLSRNGKTQIIKANLNLN